MDEFGDEMRF